MKIPEQFVLDLKSRVSIEELVSSYLPLKRRGSLAVGLCPFHSERSPSFTVYTANDSFHCFGCGASGDVISFVRRIENLGYVEAVKLLAERAGMQVPEGADDQESQLRLRVLALNRALARFYHQCLREPVGKTALDYLHQRGVQNQTIVRFGLGYAPANGEGLSYLRSQGYREEELLAAGVAAKGRREGRPYECFYRRVIFPIIDLRGNVVGFGGRQLEGKGAKYLNSSDTPVFKKSRNLFAFNFAKKERAKSILLCEGYMDVVSMHQAGFCSAVATLGTALTGEQARLIAQYTNLVTLSYDSDEAGQKATRRAVELLEQAGVKAQILSIPEAKDPDEYIRRFGADRFSLLVDRASSSTEYEIEQLRRRFDVEQAEGKLAFMRGFIALMLRLPNQIEQDVYITKICNETGIQRDAVTAQMERERKRMSRRQKKDADELKVYSEVRGKEAGRYSPMDVQRAQNIRYALAEDKLLAILLKNPDYYSHAARRITTADFVTDRNRILAEILFTRLAQGQSIDLALLNGLCTLEQMDILSQLQQSTSGIQYAPEDMDAYIDVILSHKQQKTQEEVAQMPKEDLGAYVAELSRKKK